jgi:23S rRNA (cytosine1962-C5)-methyltransferase
MATLDLQPKLMIGEGWDSYRLLDSGHGRKLEQYGPYRFIRPEGQALWAPRLADWQADGEFIPGSDEDGGGRWNQSAKVPRDGWPLGWEDVRFTAQCTPFRHLAFFPDMAPVWDWMGEQLGPRAGGGHGQPAGISSPLPFRGGAGGGDSPADRKSVV